MKLKKYEKNPIIAPNPANAWENLVTCNPGVIYDDGRFYMLYRAAGDDKEHVIRLGLAVSENGFNFRRVGAFSFKSKDSAEKENNASDSLKDSGFYINLRHAQSILVDERYFKIEFTFWLEPFLVWINGQMYQIDAGAFMMNSVLFIAFEVINYKTGKPLAKDDVGAKAENYNLLSVEKYQFFDEEKPVEAGMKISEIIYENISEFIWELTNKCYRSQEYFFVHDTLVFSNNIENISDYFCKLIDTKAPAEPIKDISTVEIYQYYPQAGCSVVSDFDCDNFQPILYSAIILESLKLYIHIFQNSNLENETDLRRSVRNDIYLQNLFCSPNLPIETHNLLNYIKESEPYKKHAEAAAQAADCLCRADR